MIARKPKPRKPASRKASGPTLEQRVAILEKLADIASGWMFRHDEGDEVNDDFLRKCAARLDALEARASLRDKSQDAPLSNAGEAIGQHFRIVGERAPWWRRLIGFMGAP